MVDKFDAVRFEDNSDSDDSIMKMIVDELYQEQNVDNYDAIFKDKLQRKRKAVVLLSAVEACKKVWILDRNQNRPTTRRESVVEMINQLKTTDPRFFTRMFRLTPHSFDKLLSIISESLTPISPGGKNIISPMIQLCIALRILAGGSYLDLSLLYDIPKNTVHQYAFRVVNIIDRCKDPWVDNIHFPIDDYNKLTTLSLLGS